MVNFPTLSHFCPMSFLGGGGWVLKEIWSMSLIIRFFLVFPNECFLIEDVQQTCTSYRKYT